ncbi:MAG: lytic murein transglycosylase [Acidisphaera sp.]|nr:lytic murein transglycosylase [Acidisphaera sp.]
MLSRRTLLAAGAAFTAAPALAAVEVSASDAASFAAYLDGVRQEARAAGISDSVLSRALAGLHINPRVIDLDRNQPEVQFTWARYRASIVSDNRVTGGRAQMARHGALLRQVEAAYGVPGPIIVGLWGLESDYGRDVGRFNVIQAVATLAWEGRRRDYFHEQLMDCLRILQRGDIEPAQMLGSWAGAMGQTQFMPDSFLKYAVDWSRTGRRDLWNDFGCVFASTANNLAQEGWVRGEAWGSQVVLPATFDPALIGRPIRRSVQEWLNRGVRRQDGTALPLAPGVAASLIQPGQAEGDPDTYLVSAAQFAALRAYNPSDKYALCIGLLADGIRVA